MALFGATGEFQDISTEIVQQGKVLGAGSGSEGEKRTAMTLCRNWFAGGYVRFSSHAETADANFSSTAASESTTSAAPTVVVVKEKPMPTLKRLLSLIVQLLGLLVLFFAWLVGDYFLHGPLRSTLTDFAVRFLSCGPPAPPEDKHCIMCGSANVVI